MKKDQNPTEIYNMKRIIINTQKSPNPIGPYNQAILAENILFISGQIALDPVAKKLVNNDLKKETMLVMNNLKAILESENLSFENVIKSKVIELAEGVIGYQIEKFPDKFLKKIKNSINEIKSINNDIKICLNDDDFELLNKFIENNKSEITFKLELDSSLGRGDFTIDMGGVIQAIKYKKVIE